MTETKTQSTETQNLTHQLFEAIHAYDADGVRKSIEQGADVNQRDPLDWYGLGSPPVHFACGRAINQLRSLEIIETLLVAGADPNEMGDEFTGETAIHYTAKVDNPEEMRLLVNHGADITALSNQGDTPMATALKSLQVSQVAVLQELGISINTPVGAYSSGIVCAINAQKNNVLRQYLEMGADPNFSPSGGESPLMACVKEGRVESIRILLAAGADINAVTSYGNTFLHYIAREIYARENLIPLALDAGADPNAQNETGETPLMVAILSYNRGVIDKLYHHSNLRLTDYEGNTIWHHVIRTQDVNLIEHIFEESMGVVYQDPVVETGEFSLEEWRGFFNQPNENLTTPRQIAESFENTEIRDTVEYCILFAEKYDITRPETIEPQMDEEEARDNQENPENPEIPENQENP